MERVENFVSCLSPVLTELKLETSCIPGGLPNVLFKSLGDVLFYVIRWLFE